MLVRQRWIWRTRLGQQGVDRQYRIRDPDGVLLAVDASEKLANLTSVANIQLQPGALVL